MSSHNDDDGEDWEDFLERKGKTIQMEKLQALKLRFIDPPAYIFDHPDRKVYHEGLVHRQTRFKTSVRRCVVMSDLLVFAKPVRERGLGEKLAIKQVLDLRKITLNNHVKGLKFGFVVQTQEQQYVLAAQSEQERQEWVRLITKAIVDLRNKDGGTKNPLDNAMQHLQGLLKGEDDPVLADSVRQVLELLESVKKSSSGLLSKQAKKSILRKKIDKNIKSQAPDVASWLKEEFMSGPGGGGGSKDREISVSRVHPHARDSQVASHRIANLFIEQARKARESKSLRRVLSMMRRRKQIAAEMGAAAAAAEEDVTARLLLDVRLAQRRESPFHQIQFQLSGWLARLMLKRAEDWDAFDVWRLDDCTMGRPLSCLAWHLFQANGFFEKFNIKQPDFARFITTIEDGYNDVPYHNRLHATDVLQNICCFLATSSFRSVASAQDLMSAFVAAAIHDFRHPGTTNIFHINTESEYAIQFNDISVLENMHSAEAFRVMRTAGMDILSGVSVAQRKEIRETIIAMVLATDMKKHFELHQELHDYVDQKAAEAAAAAEGGAAGSASGPSSPSSASPAEAKKQQHKGVPKLLYLQAAMHCSDLGNPAKPLPLYLRWTDLIMVEFYAQGDRERELGLPISPMCDRTKPALEKSQIGFISVIVKPLFGTFTKLIAEMAPALTHLDINQLYWQEELNKNAPAPAPAPAPTSGIPSVSPPSAGPNSTSSAAPSSSSSSSSTTSASSSASSAPVSISIPVAKANHKT